VILHHPGQIAELLARHPDVRVLSIDMFDTLVFRKTFAPESAFHLQHARLRTAGLLMGTAAAWVALRKDHEHALAQAAAPGETTLAAIYESVAKALGWSSAQADLALALELEIEAELIRPYPDVIAALADLERAGIAILVQTDTYLPASFIASLLDRHLPFPYALRCSSQTGAPKRSGLAYARLRADFGTSAIHLGDNRRVDVVLARKAGVKAWQVDWRRARMLRDTLQPRYAAALGLHGVRTPWDQNEGGAVAELAFRWSFVLADFMLALREHADAINATDIWLLSRDCESIAAAANAVPHVLGERTVRYVDCSRSSCHPILAATDPARFASWGYAVTEDRLRAGEAAIAYYRSQLTSRSRKVLIVDNGWKGRLQAAIASVLGEVEVHGFYFSLEPGAELEAQARSATFLRWDPRTFFQPVVEALAGFATTSCARFVLAEDGQPVLSANHPRAIDRLSRTATPCGRT
jgi:phosphoglycolate phosphatase-like HAD superfamily hydrolase